MPLKTYHSNFTNEDINPCLAESNLATKCLETELYEYEKCSAYFENYRQCKKFWGLVSKQRQKAGILPKLPAKAERDEIMKLKFEKKSDVTGS